jgi:hypothetical protein
MTDKKAGSTVNFEFDFTKININKASLDLHSEIDQFP